jgi:hypothetical protein
MNEGMLWYDNNPKATFAQRILQAIEYYKHKYGKTPTSCLVHPKALQVEQNLSDGHIPVMVKAASYVLPNHFLLGIDEGD